MENVQIKVEGMDCANCALTIHKFLEKEGGKNVKVNFATGDVSFDTEKPIDNFSRGIKDLGYAIASDISSGPDGLSPRKKWLSTHWQRFWFCFPFAALFLLHMVPGVSLHWMMDPYVQLVLTLPVFIVGMQFFGKSAWKSLRNGIPNMNVLIAIGALASFIYSLYGTLTHQASHFMFYETTVTIITLVFLGNYLEEAAVGSTQSALNKLAVSQKVMANMIAFDDQHVEHVFPVESAHLKSGDLILIRNGDQVPADCKILWGEASVSEAIITGESIPVAKIAKDRLIGGSLLLEGTVKAQVTAAGKDTVLAGILQLVKQAQGEKPPVQQLADKISAIFVPVVIGLALVTLAVNWIVLGAFAPALLRSIAVLVIACPCAMGLATPAAIAVGLGRGARNGILFRNAKSLELFKDIRQVVFDKTGTLTTGQFVITDVKITGLVNEEAFKSIVFSLEKYSNHPLAKAICATWKSSELLRWATTQEIKGLGIRATDKEGNLYEAGSYKMVAGLSADDTHSIYVAKNKQLIGWIDLRDEIRGEAKPVIDYLKARGIRTILLSGDRTLPTEQLGKSLGIEEIIAEQTPEQKLLVLERLTANQPTAMVGDGINDAPALAKATIGISMSDASHIAVQTAQVVLMNNGLKNLPMALGLGKHTYTTIRQNLFWAFLYNVIAIPIAAMGWLTPMFAALAMGLSDVVLAINSIRLFVKKVS